jgi:hypothetical protein
MLITDVLQPQPDFPRVDLTSENASWLGMAMGNEGILNRGHRLAELHYGIFRATHTPLTIASENLFDSPGNKRAINFGITALEAITLLVAADNPAADVIALESNINGIVAVTNVCGVAEYFEQAQADFLTDAPNTAGVIHEAAGRLFDPRMAVLGGAIARQFELDNLAED